MKKTFLIIFVCASMTTYAQLPCGPKLVMHWDFTGGSTTESINGWAPLATPWPMPTPTAGRNGNPNTAMKFSPGQNLVYAQDNLVMDLESWTITAVVRPDGFQSTLCQINRIVTRGNDYSPYHYSLCYSDQQVDDNCNNFWPAQEVFSAAAAGHSDFAIGEWVGYPSPGANPYINPGQWYCITASYDAPTGSMDLWVDGVHVVSENMPPTTPPYHYWHNQYGYPSPINYDLYIGSSNGPSSLFPYWLDGAIDDLKIYSGSIGNCPGWAERECLSDQFKTTSINKIDDAAMVGILPNPASDVIKITVPSDWKNGDITVFNEFGAMVQHNDACNSGVTSIDISKLPTGVYMIDVEFSGHSSMKKFIKK